MKHSSAAGPGGTAVTEPDPGSGHAAVRSRRVNWFRGHATAVICVAAVLVVAVVFAVTRLSSAPRRPTALEPVRYLGVYERSAPGSYAGIDQFGQTIGKQPDLAAYYSSWGEPFAGRVRRRGRAARRRAAGADQPGPRSLTAITAGRYDAYLRRFADAVRAYQHRVILGFGHEPNGYWFSVGLLARYRGIIRRGLAAHRHRVPHPGRVQRQLAVDRQHHRHHRAASNRLPPGGRVIRT